MVTYKLYNVIYGILCRSGVMSYNYDEICQMQDMLTHPVVYQQRACYVLGKK